ncbi:MAG: hypothetical protein AAGB19_05430 [Cyanobacteria bacterium P01_F01_bin.3]
MKPLCAKPLEANVETDLLANVDTSRRVFSEFSAREISIIDELRSLERAHQILRFLCASRDAEEAVSLSGQLNDEFDKTRYEQCEFYQAEIDHWREYWATANAA